MIPKCFRWDGNDNIYQEGGSGNDTIRVCYLRGTTQQLLMLGQEMTPSSMTLILEVTTASFNGGTGTDKLTVNNRFSLPFLIQDINSNMIYQSGVGGTTITVTNIEQITVNDAGGNPIFTWP